jgi:FHA domain
VQKAPEQTKSLYDQAEEELMSNDGQHGGGGYPPYGQPYPQQGQPNQGYPGQQPFQGQPGQPYYAPQQPPQQPDPYNPYGQPMQGQPMPGQPMQPQYDQYGQPIYPQQPQYAPQQGAPQPYAPQGAPQQAPYGAPYGQQPPMNPAMNPAGNPAPMPLSPGGPGMYAPPPAGPGGGPGAVQPAPAPPGQGALPYEPPPVIPANLPPNALRAFVVSYQSNPQGEFWALNGGRTTVGRANSGEQVDLPLPDATTSSKHAAFIIDVATGVVTLEDRGSTNGTYVNEEHIGFSGRRDLRDGDRVRFGGFTTVVKILPRS